MIIFLVEKTNLVKLILESYSKLDDIGILGNSLLKFADDQDHDIFLDDDFSKEVSYLRELDDLNNLLWIDFYSWNNVSLPIRNKIKNKIKCVEYNSLYMPYSEIDTFKFLINSDDYSVYVLQIGNVHRLIILGGDYDAIYAKDKKYLDRIAQLIEESLVYKFQTRKEVDCG